MYSEDFGLLFNPFDSPSSALWMTASGGSITGDVPEILVISETATFSERTKPFEPMKLQREHTEQHQLISRNIHDPPWRAIHWRRLGGRAFSILFFKRARKRL